MGRGVGWIVGKLRLPSGTYILEEDKTVYSSPTQGIQRRAGPNVVPLRKLRGFERNGNVVLDGWLNKHKRVGNCGNVEKVNLSST